MSLTKVTNSLIQGAPANVLDYGADKTGVLNSSVAIELALNSGAGVVIIPPGTYRITAAMVATNAALKRIEGYGATLRADITTVTSVYMLDTGTNDIQVSIAGLVFDSASPDTTRNETWYGGTFSYDYRNFNAGLYVPDGSIVDGCVFKQLYDALYIGTNSGFPFDRRTKVVNCRFEENLKTFTGYLCNFLEFAGNTAYLGSEITFPSCRNLTITNNSVFLPGTPAIDVGGSATAAGTQLIIANNISYGRDGIVVEGGFDDVIITGNQCYSTSDSPNGYGIGVSTNTGGQEINRLLISDNIISRYNDPIGSLSQYAFGIRVFASIAWHIRDIQVQGNRIIAPGTGISVEGFDATNRATGVTIRDNVVTDIRVNGIACGYATNVDISNNVLTSNATVTVGKGVYLNGIIHGRLSKNSTTSFRTNHYYFEGVQSDVLLDSPYHNATTESLLWGFSAVAGNLVCRDVVFPTGGVPTIGQWSQSSFIINPVPASGAFFGTTCTVSGSPGTWKTYGLIS